MEAKDGRNAGPKIEYKDYPFHEIADAMWKHAEDGNKCFQKFTCTNCGKRLTIEVPNSMFRTGSCDSCGHITDIEKQGCNYMLHVLIKRKAADF